MFCKLERIFENICEYVTQRNIPATLMGDVIFLPYVFYFNDWFA